MNDSAYGLTAALWTSDPEAAMAIGDRLETGTVFMNRCDYLDPALAWTGVKNSGRGVTLSVQALALASGSPLDGAVIMAVFVGGLGLLVYNVRRKMRGDEPAETLRIVLLMVLIGSIIGLKLVSDI